MKLKFQIKEEKFNKNKIFKLNKVQTNNLRNLDITLPLGNFITVTGVSGSGKSSLIIDTLYQRLDEYFNKSLSKDESRFNIKGINNIDKVIDIDQSPIGRTPRSNPATYTGCFTPIRDWFANLNESMREDISLVDFHLMLKVVDVSHVKVMELKKLKCIFLQMFM